MTPVDFGLAFLVGFGGSVHCLGMCSIFALAVARSTVEGRARSLLHHALYSGGRLSSYLFMGLLAGTLGQSLGILVPLKIAQVALTILAGAAMVVVGLRMVGLPVDFRFPISDMGLRMSEIVHSQSSILNPQSSIRTLMPPAGPSQAFCLGLLNGLLPCPLVYALLPAAFATGSGAQGGLLMLALGAGTLPMMLSVGIAGQTRILQARRLARLPGWAVLLFGFVTLGRAFSLWGPWTHTLGHGPMP